MPQFTRAAEATGYTSKRDMRNENKVEDEREESYLPLLP
jgi:hypothetical protein